MYRHDHVVSCRVGTTGPDGDGGAARGRILCDPPRLVSPIRFILGTGAIARSILHDYVPRVAQHVCIALGYFLAPRKPNIRFEASNSRSGGGRVVQMELCSPNTLHDYLQVGSPCVCTPTVLYCTVLYPRRMQGWDETGMRMAHNWA